MKLASALSTVLVVTLAACGGGGGGSTDGGGGGDLRGAGADLTGGGGTSCPGFTGSCNVATAYQCADVFGTDVAKLEMACSNAGGTWSTTSHCPAHSTAPATDKVFGCVVMGNLLEPTATCKTQWFYAPLNMASSASTVCGLFHGTVVQP